MPSSDFFNPKESLLADPWELTLVKDWIINFVRFSKVTPDLVDRFANNPSEFKMIPIPTKLFESLGNLGYDQPGRSASAHFPMPGGGYTDPLPMFSEKLTRLETIRHYDTLAGLLLDFAKHVEAGDMKNAMSLVSENYLDFSGRTKEKLGNDIKNLVDAASNRRLILTNSEEFHVLGEKIRAVVKGAWQANIKDHKNPISESFRLEIIFSSTGDTWKISSIEGT